MKLLVFCLFAVCCSSLARTAETKEKRKLQEVMDELRVVRIMLKNNETVLNIPPQDIEDCCGPSALRCFRASLNLKFNITDKTPGKKGKLYRSLGKNLTEKGLTSTCNSENAQLNCQDRCDSHPTGNVTEFFNSLESLIQKAIFKLIME